MKIAVLAALLALILLPSVATAEGEAGVVRGTIVGPDGSPVARARVSTSFANVVSASEHAIVAGEDGTFVLRDVPVGPRIVVYATGAGFGLGRTERFRLDEEAPDREDLVVSLPPGATIRGHATDAAGDPLAGADVVVTGVHRRLGMRPPPAVTGPDGAFELSSLPSGVWKVAVVAEGLAPAWRTELSVGEGEAIEDLEFVLGEGRFLEGLVVDAEGRPVPDEPVSVRPIGFPVPGVARRTAQTDEQGRFEIRHLPELPCFLSMGSRRVESYRQKVHLDESPLTLRVEVLGDLRGRVMSASGGPPPDEFTLFVMPTGATTPYPTWIAPSPYRRISDSPDGRFHVAGFRPGLYDLIVLAEDQVSNRVNRVRIESWRVTEIDAPFVLTAAGGVQGRILDADGHPVQGAKATLLTKEGKPARGWATSATTSGDGRYQLWGVPAGTWRLVAMGPGGAEAAVEVEIPAGERIDRDVTLR